MALDDDLNEIILSDTQLELILGEVIEKFLIPHFRSLGLNATGEWIESLHVRGDTIRGRKYTEQLEYGRRPYPNQPDKYVPIGQLIKWVEVKIGLRGEEAKRMAYAVRYNIAQYGTSHYRKGGNELIEVLESAEVVGYIRERLFFLARANVTLFVSQAIKETFKN